MNLYVKKYVKEISYVSRILGSRVGRVNGAVVSLVWIGIQDINSADAYIPPVRGISAMCRVPCLIFCDLITSFFFFSLGTCHSVQLQQSCYPSRNPFPNVLFTLSSFVWISAVVSEVSCSQLFNWTIWKCLCSLVYKTQLSVGMLSLWKYAWLLPQSIL